MLVALAVAVTLMVGLIIGFLVSGGQEQAAAPTSTAASTVPPEPDPVPTLPPGTSGEFVLPAREDTYVNSESPGELKGGDEALEVEDDPPEIKQALVRFEVAGVPADQPIRRALLRLFVLEESDSAVTVHLVAGDWSETDTTWANAPAVGEMVASFVPSAEGSLVEVDVTSAVSGPGRVDFYLTTASDDSAEFASREAAANGPALVVVWGDAELHERSGSVGVTVPQLTGEPARLVGAGDIADCDSEGDEATAALLDGIFEQSGEGVVFTTGDNAYSDGSREEFAACYEPTWGRHKERTRPAPGNHDYGAAEASGYFDYFGSSAGAPGEGYYSYDLGDWNIVVLNSNCDEVGGCQEGSPQEAWLRSELAGSSGCTLAYWHHPLFSSSDRGGNEEVRPLFAALYEHGAEVVINGHDHHYERFAPQDPDGVHDPVTGIRQFVVGTGGKSLTGFDGIAPNSEVRFDDAYGVLHLALYADGYAWTFVPEAGEQFTDPGTGVCH